MSDMMSFMLKSAAGQTLGALSSILTKAEAHARALKVEDTVLLNARLYPDMLPLTRQIQIACDTMARGAARLAGMDIPSFPDTETDFPALRARIAGVMTYVMAVDDKTLDGAAHTIITVPLGPNTMEWPGREYLASFILPNLHFHASMAYALLRHQGVVLGKADYLRPGA
jgi:hypothetical protein